MNSQLLKQSMQAIQNGECIVYPTDTLYALGANVYNQNAVQKIFSIKNRPITQPLPIGVSSYAEITAIAETTSTVQNLADIFLPGALTLILPLKDKYICSNLIGKNNTIAIRIPDDPIALHILKNTGPLTITSANKHNMDVFSTVQKIKKQLSSEDVTIYIDDGQRTKSPSTIVDVCSEYLKIIREGKISIHQIQKAIHNG